MSVLTITGDSTMGEVLEVYPSAQRALFRRYHIGGCNSCGYELGDRLEEVARSHDNLDLEEVIAFLEDAEQIDRRAQVSPREVAASLASGKSPRLLDVRSPAEWELARIEGATLMTEAMAEIVMRWPATPRSCSTATSGSAATTPRRTSQGTASPRPAR